MTKGSDAWCAHAQHNRYNHRKTDKGFPIETQK